MKTNFYLAAALVLHMAQPCLAGSAGTEEKRAEINVDYASASSEYGPRLFGTMASPFYNADGFLLAKQAGFKLMEIHIKPFDMAKNPDHPASYDFALLDKQVQAALDIGAEPFLLFMAHQTQPDLEKLAKTTKNTIAHLTAGWGGGHRWPLKLFRFGNEPDNTFMWRGSKAEFFRMYEVWARATLSAVPDAILTAPGILGARMKGGKLNEWIPEFLDYLSKNSVPLDYFSVHAYSAITKPSFYDDFMLVRAELQKYPGVSPHFGAPKLANDEWNLMVGDLWSGSYLKSFDTAWAAAHNATAFLNMIEAGVELSIRYGGTFNGTMGCHDFLLTDCDNQGKPAYYAFRGLSWLEGSARLAVSGMDPMNSMAAAGRKEGWVIVALASYDVERYIREYPDPRGHNSRLLEMYTRRFGAQEAKDGFRLTIINTPWREGQKVKYERYLVDDTRKLELVESKTATGGPAMVFEGPMPAPSVSFIVITPI